MSQDPQGPNPINLGIGRRLRLKREIAGLTQSALGQKIDVSRIKIGQYESGQIPIPASKLFLLAQVFNVNVNYFFKADDQTPALAEFEDIDPLLNKLSISLLKDFEQLDQPEVRQSLAAVMERAAELLNENNKNTK
ncbi:transcriptional regulator [Terasakiella brassicae]|uniref:Transcriptional regulator n=1 Tax=Terasakiella brassicae TaxID=1634917 RepID=A0A917C6L1_9PROT|nr:helix-turn-helix transcriptional regulator [Terasakiella brassicae]GGF72997.1 transcriptional regulator [Terasakiella brassicae]